MITKILHILSPATSYTFAEVAPDRSSVKQKGFSTVIEPLFRYHTSNLIQAHRWQKSHPLRQKALTYFAPLQRRWKDIFLIPRVQTQVCTVTALNVFSLFVEARTNQNLYQSDAGKGVEALRGKVEDIQKLNGEKGIAFLCKLMGQADGLIGSFHDFVLEVNPKGEIYLYQSYVNKYDFYHALHMPQFGPWSLDNLAKNLSLVASQEREWTEERNHAYENLFNVADEKLGQLELTFTSIEYDPQSIPVVPQKEKLRKRIAQLWLGVFKRS